MTKDLQSEQQKYVDYIERINGGAASRLTWEDLYAILDHLTEGVPNIIQPIKTSNSLLRGRIIEKDSLNRVEQLSYPPNKLCLSYGRCNKPNLPVCYAGIGYELIFSELGAQEGDYVGIAGLRPTEDLFFLRLGALDIWRRTSGNCLLPDAVKQQIKEIHADPKNIVAFILDAFISDWFSKKGNSVTYKLTSAYTSVLFNTYQELSGIIYDSVNHTKGSCISIKDTAFDNYFSFTEFQVVKIKSYLGYGIYDWELIQSAKDTKEGFICWE
ncbi:hypothetical protein [Vreelandella arctica]|uniref:hypothetical protein n=1 Tax=Vreelandella arctica TaxID=3126499 RepID=UPI00300DEFB1